jgi:hypothetical protein
VVLVASVLASVALAPAHFPARPGWHVGAGRIHACPDVPAARCRSVTSWAATVRWRDCPECLPHRTVEALPPGGVAIQLSLADTKSPGWVKPMRWVPRLRPVVTPFEGLPPRIGVVQLIGRLRGFEAYLWVFYGRPRPTAHQVALARAELRVGRLP